MDKKIIFFDIDGTIITEDTNFIPSSTKNSIRQAQSNGHLTFINTGRPISEINSYLRELNFDGYVCGCGTYIEFKDEILLYKSLGNKLSKEIAEKLRKYNLDGILEGKESIYYDSVIHSDRVLNIKKLHISENFYHGATWDDPNINFDKFVLWINENSNFEGFYEEFKNIFEFIKRDSDFYEVVPLGFSKASGIKFLLDKLSIPFENTYAIGDSTNDLSMLKYVKNSIAMGNSNPILFDLVSFITKDINDDGIEHALKHYNII